MSSPILSSLDSPIGELANSLQVPSARSFADGNGDK